MRGKTLSIVGLLLATSGVFLFVVFREPETTRPQGEAVETTVSPSPGAPEDEISALLAAYATSTSCQECHPKQFESWKGSHHAGAERPLDLEIDRAAFYPSRTFTHGTQTSTARVSDDRFEIETIGLDGKKRAHPVERVFGVSPLYQFLVPAAGGRYQVTEVAFDPMRAEWFNVYGDENREPGEWGHWTGRGMTWNSMCASCHNTRLLKGYNEKTDSYNTRMAEMGVGCEACHGPLRDHVDWQKREPDNPSLDPGLFRLSKGHILPMCGSCHSRRRELTGNFHPGDDFLDHFSPQIPDETDIYYADGQVREEDFEFVSFIGSRMHNEGIRCANCHDPHSGKTKFTGNALCLQCHKGKIDPGPHSHHEPGTPGGNCVDCHMPLTTYMARHPRRDHGFTIPDPVMTQDYGIPNACNRCHDDKSVEWAISAVTRRHGSRMERHTRARTRVVSGARTGEEGALGRLLVMSRDEKHPFWRAVMAGLLKLWPGDEGAHHQLAELTFDEHPLVRGTAARALGGAVPLGLKKVQAALTRRLKDPVRMVRFEAAWSLRRSVDPGSRAGNDLWTALKLNADQPAGAMQLAVFNLDRGFPAAALPHLERAVRWDARSAPLREGYAVCLSLLGNGREAVSQLRAACRLAPTDPINHHKLGLALNEVGDLPGALKSFEKAVELARNFDRAWYSLGLARSKLGDPERGLEAIRTAERLNRNSPDYPYARAVILYGQGRLNETRDAVQSALHVDADYVPAKELAEQLAELLDRGG